MQTSELPGFMKSYRERLIKAIGNGTYQPQPVLGIEIPKLSGGKRQLGIPTVTDHVIQQAVHRVSSPMYEIEFMPGSHGFLPTRGPHRAIRQSSHHVNPGYQDIIDLDLKNFFDVVGHDLLMGIPYRKVKGEGLLRLIRQYLKAGAMVGGVGGQREMGTPQGSPLSPPIVKHSVERIGQRAKQQGTSLCSLRR